MTKPTPDELFTKILEAIAQIDQDQGSRLKAMKLIHDQYDPALADAMSRWLETQEVKIATVMSTLAHMLGAEMYYFAENEAEICFTAEAYASYLHNVAHALWRKHGKSSKKSS